MAKRSSLDAIEQTRTPLGPGSFVRWLDEAGQARSGTIVSAVDGGWAVRSGSKVVGITGDELVGIAPRGSKRKGFSSGASGGGFTVTLYDASGEKLRAQRVSSAEEAKLLEFEMSRDHAGMGAYAVTTKAK
jgi:hypothetical protein